MRESRIISSDARTVNFREIHMGDIAPGMLYRSSHPVKDNRQERVISVLAGQAKISTVINLCDTGSSILSKALFAPWYNSLLKNDRVIALGMDFNLASASFNRKLKDSFRFIIKTDGPWLIHCHAGVDRTGFVCMVLESFMGAKLDDVIGDFLFSFNSIFESSIYEAQKADSQMVIKILSIMSDSMAVNEQNLQHIAEIYLINKIGLSVLEIEWLKGKLGGIQEKSK